MRRPRPAIRLSAWFASVSLIGLASGAAARAQVPAPAAGQALPQPLAMPPAIPAPRDIAYPGTLGLEVNATDLDRHVFSVTETIPVPDEIARSGGDMVLLYPKWLPGNHSPSGPIDQFGGLVVSAEGKPLAWARDTVDVYAFHVPVPKGAKSLEAKFQFLSPITREEGRVVMTPDLLNLQWNATALYPAGYFSRDIKVDARVVLPEGWGYGTALRPLKAQRDDGARLAPIAFQTVDFATLVDSPLFAGRYYRKIDLTPSGSNAPVSLDLFADTPDSLDATPAQIAAHRALVTQAYLLFGSHHYAHYDFLLALTKQLGGIGLEHHQSSENSGPPGYFTEWDKTFPMRDLLAHEYTHSWNGKFRRPADLWAPNFDVPERDSLLWVYEGQTQYWGYVLAARAGLITADQARDAIAAVAATYDNRAGRLWRPVQDTTNDPIIAQRAPLSWTSWQRSEDYYSEGQLIWLDADTLIRKLSGDRHSLDDFAARFFGVDSGSYVTAPYKFEDVVAALNAVQPYDWASFLRARLDRVGPGAPLDGLAQGGWKLVYTETPTPYLKAYQDERKLHDYSYSIGLRLDNDAHLTDVAWGGPAWKAGLARDATLLAVNGVAYTPERLSAAITAAKPDKGAPGQALTLLVKAGERYRTVSLDYHGGLRYPHLERIDGAPDRLDQILASRK